MATAILGAENPGRKRYGDRAKSLHCPDILVLKTDRMSANGKIALLRSFREGD